MVAEHIVFLINYIARKYLDKHMKPNEPIHLKNSYILFIAIQTYITKARISGLSNFKV